MRLLKVGGIEPFYSQEREQRPQQRGRAKNPYFYEHDDALMLGNLADYPDLEGKAVKVSTAGLASLPTGFRCKLVVLARSVLSRRMSAKSAEQVVISSEELERAEEAYLRGLAYYVQRFAGLAVLYDDLIDSSSSELDRVISYLGVPLDKAAMLKEINPELRHWKEGKPSKPNS